jgi:tetratricopeptide (TPR) repeat protein
MEAAPVMMRSAKRPWPIVVVGCLTAVLLVAPPILAAEEASFEHAMSLFRAREYERAADEFSVVLEQNPDWVDGLFLIGLCRLKTGRADEAVDYFRRAIARKDDKSEYHFSLARAYIKLRRYEEAKSALGDAEPLASPEQLRRLHKMRAMLRGLMIDWSQYEIIDMYDLPPQYWRDYPAADRSEE